MSRVLVVEDDAKLRNGIAYSLRGAGFTVELAASAEEARDRLDEVAAELLLLDVRLPGASGVELVRELAAAGRLPPTVVVSGEATIGETVAALRLGVDDFVEKPFSRERLLQSVRNTLARARLARRVADLESLLPDEDQQLLGGSPAMVKLRAEIGRVAPVGGRVLIRGESGSGKELVARALHRQGPRRDAPLVTLNCAALPAHLVEDELFGHARGAFTDAREPRTGLFEEADRGTLFLDEIGDMELALQGRLLRVLEDGRVRRLGETRDRRVDVWVIAATHRDLEAAIAAGRFRQDLYYRLAHLPIEVPPLRQRTEDLPELVHSFLTRFAARHRTRAQRVEPEVLRLLARYPWPGNVRELQNLCERLAVFASDPIRAADLPTPLLAPAAETEIGLVRLPAGRELLPLRAFRAAVEREYLERVLRQVDWNVAAAARLLRLRRSSLHDKLAVLGIRRPRPG